MYPSHYDNPALVSLYSNPVEIIEKEIMLHLLTEMEKSSVAGSKIPKLWLKHSIRGRWICHHVLFCSCYENNETSSEGRFHAFSHSRRLIFGCHEVWRWGMSGIVTCCSCLPWKSSSIFLSLQLGLPLRIFSAGTWKRKPCDHGGPYGVLFLLFC